MFVLSYELDGSKLDEVLESSDELRMGFIQSMKIQNQNFKRAICANRKLAGENEHLRKRLN